MAFVKHTQSQSIVQEKRTRTRDLAGLIDELHDTNPVARRWAARDLAMYPEASSALVEQLKKENENSVCEAILLSLVKIGDQIAVAGLIECLRSDDALLRNEAIEALKLLPDAVALIITNLLSDPDPDMRIFAINILESLRHPEVEKWLISVIENDENVNVCSTAVDLLGEIGTKNSLTPLEKLKKRFSDEPYIVFAIDLALERINRE